MSSRERTRYAFTDPLGAAASDDARSARDLLRRVGIFLYAAAAATLGITLLTPDSNTSDHTGIATVGALCALMAIVFKVWRRPPDWALLAGMPFGTVLISVLVAVAKPLALIPMFYIWPLVITAYCLQRREIIINFALVVVGFGAALLLGAVPDARLVQWVSICVVGAVLVVLVVALKDGLNIALQRLRTLATHDPLTGALNRRAFADALDAAVARVGRGENTCSVAILDVDHFKTINDRFGHAEGDRALQALTELLAERARRGDVVGRLGGEEFAVLLGGTGAPGAERFAEDLREAIALATGAGSDKGFTVSIGVAELGDGDGTAEGMVLAADRALYAAKDAGRNRVMRAAGGLRHAA